ncbi:Holliday junction ATP-dependent DNA helicase RuvA [Paenibacillus sp. J31TS4]|uniref:Holliday junction branch migration protein RuvA n=1 Tax=Paenibacillus sp. J31TS4 TaxID=2807195 RepID=UPI001B02F88C|nr:Holliday junction branch migration protein RuvA [Paenibacillus sp. J31TS4]GIP39220.1 Holliday junction ATP-dependent DNA helicase RuvA [Paenibacillus sp. J31TS4]
MIDFLRGQLAHREADYVVLDVNGVGYRVFCANPYAVQEEPGRPLTMYIHQQVREDAILLFGFASREEQTLFRRLIEVNGIGPKVALGILSAGRPDAVVSAIYQENVTFLTKLPGIGKKTAQRIILDLKDKLADLPMSPVAIQGGAGAVAIAASLEVTTGDEAKQALFALGYSEAEVERIWPAVRERTGEADSVDVIVKQALQILFRG